MDYYVWFVSNVVLSKNRRISVAPGDNYGSWTVLFEDASKPFSTGVKRILRCRCSCGYEASVQLNNLRSGMSTRCTKCSLSVRLDAVQRLRCTDASVNQTQAYRGYQRGAVKRGLFFDLSLEDFLELTRKACYYCGSPPSNTFQLTYAKGLHKGLPRAGAAFVYNGLDRVDPVVGYNKSNCVPCCITCNIAKSDMPLEQFKAWVSRVHQHLLREQKIGRAHV